MKFQLSQNFSDIGGKMNQKLRSEISDEFKWDLTSIYADKKEFEKDILECTN